MLLIAGAIVAGTLAGLALGGSLRTLSEIRLRWWPLALLGLALQLLPASAASGSDHAIAVGLLIASYAVLLVFVAANIRLAGFVLIAIGFALNLFVISLNGGMPVSRTALQRAYGPSYRATLAELTAGGGAKHHLARRDDVLLPLSDVIPLGGPIHLVLSAGDVFFFLGVTWVIAAGTKGPPGRHRQRVRQERPVGRDRQGRATDPPVPSESTGGDPREGARASPQLPSRS
ncbi:MAG: hypothetical protein E6G40_13440 [Actinobacteria bacterium]|nr:MAG: hypothetical protein E6G40_13440 [Actinomycetota bacterium]